MPTKKHHRYWLGKKKPHSQVTKDKIRKTLMGHSVSEKVRLAEHSPFKKGFTPWNKGKPWSKAMKKKISETNKRMGIEPKIKFVGFGKDHPRWKGGYENELWHSRQRRIRKLGNGGFHTQGEWETLKAQYNWTCPCCHKVEPKIKLTEDHIIPISKGGSDNIENIQPLCRNCNASKGNRIIIKYNYALL